jgi:GTP cyclohydrolase IA
MPVGAATSRLVPLRAVPECAERDLGAAECAAAEFLQALGVSLDSESLAETRRRRAYACTELLTACEFDVTTFPREGGHDEFALLSDVLISSEYEHYLLPLVGKAHRRHSSNRHPSSSSSGCRRLSARRPHRGLTKLARVVELFGHCLHVLERFTKHVADRLQARLCPRGVGAVIEAEHLRMTLRGVAGGRHSHDHVHPARRVARRRALPDRVPQPRRRQLKVVH